MSVKQGLKFGMAAGVGFLLVLGTALLAQVVIAQFTSGEQLTAQKLNDNFIAVANAQVPVGTIVAWHKSFTGTPAIPANWVECNGQTLSDGSSVYNGRTIPDLNGGARFLRGSAISGTLQADAFQGHRHGHSISGTINTPGGGGPGSIGGGPFIWTPQSLSILDPSAGVNGAPRTADETRPVNMSVVWIMKVR